MGVSPAPPILGFSVANKQNPAPERKENVMRDKLVAMALFTLMIVLTFFSARADETHILCLTREASESIAVAREHHSEYAMEETLIKRGVCMRVYKETMAFDAEVNWRGKPIGDRQVVGVGESNHPPWCMGSSNGL